MAAIELWTNGAGMPSAFAQRARRAEADGWDGITIVDSQNLSGDCYVGLAVAAGETTRIRLGTGVTNPFTRHAAVTASAIATVHAVSGGRATLGIGRGDSALAHLGHAPASPELGLTRLVIVGPSRDAERAEVDRAEARFLEAVAPALREASG